MIYKSKVIYTNGEIRDKGFSMFISSRVGLGVIKLVLSKKYDDSRTNYIVHGKEIAGL